MADRNGKRTGWQLVVGALLLVGLLVLAAGLLAAAGQRYDNNVAGFARAPVGCDTTLEFDASGTFVIYVETTGELGRTRGDCSAEETYDGDADARPDVQLTLRDLDGNAVELHDRPGIDYDTGDYVGSSRYSVDIAESGDHVLTVEASNPGDFAIAVGREPDDGVTLLRWLAVTSAVVGLVFGGLLLVLGGRRTGAGAGPASPDPWQPDGSVSGARWPASPPGFPVPPPTTGAPGVAAPPLPAPVPQPPPLPQPPRITSPGSDSPWPPPAR